MAAVCPSNQNPACSLWHVHVSPWQKRDNTDCDTTVFAGESRKIHGDDRCFFLDLHDWIYNCILHSTNSIEMPKA